MRHLRADRSRRTPAAWACVLLVTVVLARQVGAHEIGTTQVAATLGSGGDVRIEVTTDAAALLARLEAAAGRPRADVTGAAGYVERIRGLRDHLLPSLHALVNGREAVLEIDDVRALRPDEVSPASGGRAVSDLMAAEYAMLLESSPQVVIQLKASTEPPREFAWQYDLTAATYGLIVSFAGAAPVAEFLEGGRVSRTIALDPLAVPASRLVLARTYVALGFTHIVPYGLDHVLFVLGIFLLGRSLRPMLWQVSAFTVAHSITLGLTLYGVVPRAPSLVEPLIALSIVYVAIENLTTSELRPWRVGLVFGFGLLHGMGFAGVLRELGLPRSEFVTGLLAFNLGVEAGQLTVIAAAFVLLASWARHAGFYRRVVVVPGSLAIAATGVYWTIVRLPVW